jgi:nucleotide-binding universal stress UspA family protein
MDGAEAQAVQRHFSERCQLSGVEGSLTVEKGAIPDLICQRALLTDLIVLNVAHPPSPGLSSLGSGLRSIIWKSARPILTIPGKVSQLDKALVAFDGSSKSKEALFVATYLAECWKTSLTVLTLTDDPESTVQEYARDYLELHEIKAEFVMTSGHPETVLSMIKERDINLIVMGGYSRSAWQEVIIGSMVNFLLREAECPIFICR